MSDASQSSEKTWRRIRYAIAGLGFLIIVGTLLIDVLGAGLEGGIGPAQTFIIVIGALVIFFALAAPYLPAIYRTMTVLVFNTLLMLIVIESIFFAIGRFNTWWQEKQPPPPPAESADGSGIAVLEDEEWSWNTPAKMAYYQDQEWGTLHWREISTVGGRTREYQPFTVWRNIPFEGETVNINEDGLRVTTDTACDDDGEDYRVFVFGGSTVWGIGAPDEYTIPSELQRMLAEQVDEPVCVVNYGESGYVQTQQLIELIKQLQRGNIPDRVIFYDGANDVFSAYQNNDARVHHNIYQISARLEGREEITDESGREMSRFMNWLLNDTNTGRWLQSMIPEPERAAGGVVGNPDAAAMPVDVDRLSKDIAQIYETNYLILATVAQQYDFEFDVFWQPVIYTGEKPITQEEAAFLTGYDESLYNLQRETYAYIEDLAQEHGNMHDLADVLDDTEVTVYTDYVHLNPIGNEVVATAIMDDLTFNN